RPVPGRSIGESPGSGNHGAILRHALVAPAVAAAVTFRAISRIVHASTQEISLTKAGAPPISGDRRRFRRNSRVSHDLQGSRPYCHALAERVVIQGHLSRIRARLGEESE